MKAIDEIYNPKYGGLIIDSLNSRLKKLEHAENAAAIFIPKDGQSGPALNIMIKKLGQPTQEDAHDALEMFRELEEEQPTTAIFPQTVIKLLNVKIQEIKKAQAVMAQ
jgi:hypothetical protein